MLVLLAGCSEMPLLPGGERDAERQSQLQQIKRWKLNGRLSLATENESWTVTFYWSQDNERYLMRFIAPLGQGTYALRGGEQDGVYLLTAKNEVLRSNNAETLLRESVGWHIPVSGFKYWVLGLPEPGVQLQDQKFDTQGRMTELRQDNWNISIKRYMDAGGIELPGKIFMENDHFKLKLVVQEWDTRV